MGADRIKLTKLNREYAGDLENKCIICCEKSIAYLKELSTKYPNLIRNISAIVDDYKRNQGEVLFEGKNLCVSSYEMLASVNWNNTVLLITSDYVQEVYDKLCGQSGVVDKMEEIYFFPNFETECELEFREKYKDKELQNIIVFRSGPHSSAYVKGMDFADNARALFEYMLEQKLNERYELVWLVKNPKDFLSYEKYNNVSFVAYDWSFSGSKEEQEEYYRVLCLARYLFFTDAYGFVRNCRKDQVRVQLWHGCGFKTRVNFVRCEHRYEYTTVISDLYARIHADIYGLRDDQILITGYPKEDWLFHPIKREKYEGLGIPKADKYIFWLPTFRTTEEKLGQLNEYRINSGSGLPILDSLEKLQEINRILQKYSIVLVVKLHPFQKTDEVNCEGFSNIHLLNNNKLIEQDVQINQILGYADALLSDYSSAAVDYLLLDRPIGFTLDDVDRYADSRGFVFEDIKKWLPGSEIYEFIEFVRFINDIGIGLDPEKEKRKRIRRVMHNFDDDRSCERIVERLQIK